MGHRVPLVSTETRDYLKIPSRNRAQHSGNYSLAADVKGRRGSRGRRVGENKQVLDSAAAPCCFPTRALKKHMNVHTRTRVRTHTP